MSEIAKFKVIVAKGYSTKTVYNTHVQLNSDYTSEHLRGKKNGQKYMDQVGSVDEFVQKHIDMPGVMIVETPNSTCKLIFDIDYAFEKNSHIKTFTKEMVKCIPKVLRMSDERSNKIRAHILYNENSKHVQVKFENIYISWSDYSKIRTKMSTLMVEYLKNTEKLDYIVKEWEEYMRSKETDGKKMKNKNQKFFDDQMSGLRPVYSEKVKYDKEAVVYKRFKDSIVKPLYRLKGGKFTNISDADIPQSKIMINLYDGRERTPLALREVRVSKLKKEDYATDGDDEVDPDMVIEVVNSLGISESDDWGSWHNVLRMTKKFVGEEGKEVARTFSELSDKYSPSEFDDAWEKIDVSAINNDAGCLFGILKGNDPEKWIEIYRKYKPDLSGVSPYSDKRYAEIYEVLRKDNLIVVSRKNKRGYVYEPTTKLWEGVEGGSMVRDIMDTLEAHFKMQKKIVVNLVKKFMVKGEAVSPEIEGRVKMVNRDLHTVCTYKKMKDILETVAGKFYIKDIESKFNNVHSHMVPILGGKMVDLKLGIVMERKKEHMCTFEMPVHFLENEKKFKHVNKYMNSLFPKDESKIIYMQSFIGYLLTAENNVRQLTFFLGNGANGKSGLCNVIREMMGDYYADLRSSVFINGFKDSGPTADIVPLVGSRAGVCEETDEGMVLKEGQLKGMSGGDGMLPYERKFEEQHKAKRTFSLILATNNLPVFKTQQQAILDRMVGIDFEARFVKHPKLKNEVPINTEFAEAMGKQYLDEFFTWSVLGGVEFYKQGRSLPNLKQSDVIDEFVEDDDNIKKFLDDHCEVNENSFETTEALFDDYRNVEYEGYASKATFRNYLKNIFEYGRRNSGRGFKGVSLKSSSGYMDSE